MIWLLRFLLVVCAWIDCTKFVIIINSLIDLIWFNCRVYYYWCFLDALVLNHSFNCYYLNSIVKLMVDEFAFFFFFFFNNQLLFLSSCNIHEITHPSYNTTIIKVSIRDISIKSLIRKLLWEVIIILLLHSDL